MNHIKGYGGYMHPRAWIVLRAGPRSRRGYPGYGLNRQAPGTKHNTDTIVGILSLCVGIPVVVMLIAGVLL